MEVGFAVHLKEFPAASGVVSVRILFTGASSFTGMWFAGMLADRGHEIVAVMRREQCAYSGLRAERVARVVERCRTMWNMPFGCPAFIDVVGDEGPFDVLCHHAAETSDYRSVTFDAAAAATANTNNLAAVLKAFHDAGGRRIVLTGSVFEPGEGAGTIPLRAFNAYGVSKALTSEIVAFYAAQQDLALGKFIIPNPFGPYEEPRFTDYLMRCWRDGNPGLVRTPRYVRDNIHVSLLAKAYCAFAATIPQRGFHKLSPSGYAERQGTFAARFAREMGLRLKLETPLEEIRQRDFVEPPIRINTDVIRDVECDWDEQAAWDELADYYADRLEVERR